MNTFFHLILTSSFWSFLSVDKRTTTVYVVLSTIADVTSCRYNSSVCMSVCHNEKSESIRAHGTFIFGTSDSSVTLPRNLSPADGRSRCVGRVCLN